MVDDGNASNMSMSGGGVSGCLCWWLGFQAMVLRGLRCERTSGLRGSDPQGCRGLWALQCLKPQQL